MEAQLSFERELESEPKKTEKESKKNPQVCHPGDLRVRTWDIQVYKGEAVHIHEDAVGKCQEPETGKDGKRIGKGSFQSFLFHQSLLETKTNGV